MNLVETETISAAGALILLKKGAAALDVRSEGEFHEGAIPGFTNVPILKNEHRHQVGLEYKERGQDAAIELGLQLVEPIKARLLQDWRDHLEKKSERLIACWRGGLRSKIAASWLADSGVQAKRVEGGYKAMRRTLLDELSRVLDLMVLTGLTGSGKTELLWQLDQDFVLDLEGLANHRGSSFGGFMGSPQPTQQTFENGLAFKTLGHQSPFICESESRMVGLCVLPETLKDRMRVSPRVILDCDMRERVRRIHKEYVLDPLEAGVNDETWSKIFKSLAGSLERVQRRLGGLRYQEIRAQLQRPFLLEQKELEHHEEWITNLLKDYYDPLYSYAASKAEGPIVFKGQWQECYEYLTSCTVGWRARAHSGS